MKRILLILSLLLFAGLSAWYFTKPYDYRVNMQVPALNGTVEQSFLAWSASLDSSTVTTSTRKFNHDITREGKHYNFEWQLEEGSDRHTDISVYIRADSTGFQDRLSLLFSETLLEKHSEGLLLDYLAFLENHLANFRIRFAGRDTLTEKYCACVVTKTTQSGKAWGMMKNYPLLNGVLGDQGVQLDGRPFLAIREWDRENHTLSYDFCYPVKRSDSLPTHPEIFYRKFESVPALKAVYNGNYITSDRAWYLLLKEAERLGIEDHDLPVEIFFNNPNMGGNELEWTAEIYLPLGKKY